MNIDAFCMVPYAMILRHRNEMMSGWKEGYAIHTACVPYEPCNHRVGVDVPQLLMCVW